MNHKEFLIELSSRGTLKLCTGYRRKDVYEFEYCWYKVVSCNECVLKQVCSELFSQSLPYVTKDSQCFKDVANIHPEYFL